MKSYNYFRGNGYDKLECCGTEETCERCEEKWYLKCKLGYRPDKNCNICVKEICCENQKYSTFWSYVFIIAVVAVVIYIIYKLITASVVTQNTLPDIILGDPNASDAVSRLKQLTVGDPVYLV